MIFVANTREPIYLQIIRYFKQRIVLGELQPGETIPSRRELAQTLKINANTVQRAYKEMEEMELIKTVRNSPSTITTDELVLQEVRQQLINDAVTQFLTSIQAINVSKEEIIQIIDQQYC